jgi:hypothetical protein
MLYPEKGFALRGRWSVGIAAMSHREKLSVHGLLKRTEGAGLILVDPPMINGVGLIRLGPHARSK